MSDIVKETEVAGPGRAMKGDEILEAARPLMALGIKVFPVALAKLPTKIDKRPLAAAGHNDGTTNEATFVGMLKEAHARTGKGYTPLKPGEELAFGATLGAAGYIVLDYDTKNGGQGDKVLAQHQAQYGEACDRVTYSSISGATNVIYVSPDPERDIGNHGVWDDVDVRSSGGWVVPPGVHCSWGEWGWRSGDWEDLDENARMPTEMFRLLREASETESRPAKDPQIEEWLDANHLTHMPNPLADRQLEKYVETILTAGGRNPALKDALDWIKHQQEGIDRRSAYNKINAAWKQRMTNDGETHRLSQAWDVLGRVVGYDIAWKAAREQADAQATAPLGVVIEEDQSRADVIRGMMVTTEELANLPMPDPIVDGYLFRDSLAWIIGASGAGKSFLGVDIAMKIGTGGGIWAGRNVKGGRVLYVAAEGSTGMTMRTAAWKRFYDIGEPPAVTWIPSAINLFDPLWAMGFAEAVTDANFDMIIIDTLARSTVGAEENSAKDMGEMIQNLDRIRIASGGACVVVIHHTGKDAERGGRGSTALKGALESEITVTGSISEILYVNSSKQKNVEELDKVGFKAQKVGLGGIGLDGEELSSVVIVPATSEELDEAGSGADSESTGASDQNLFQRQATRRILKRLNKPESINRIHGELKSQGITVGVGTLKGILEKLVGEGFAVEMKGERGARLFSITAEGMLGE
jgi:hypothetical protein